MAHIKKNKDEILFRISKLKENIKGKQYRVLTIEKFPELAHVKEERFHTLLSGLSLNQWLLDYVESAIYGTEYVCTLDAELV